VFFSRHMLRSAIVLAPMLAVSFITLSKVKQLLNQRRRYSGSPLISPRSPCTEQADTPRPRADASFPVGGCLACREADRNTLLYPCRHMVLCHACSKLLMEQPGPQCPLCNASVSEVEFPIGSRRQPEREPKK
jgi:hypothetical protein